MMEQSLLNLGFRPLLEAALDASVDSSDGPKQSSWASR